MPGTLTVSLVFFSRPFGKVAFKQWNCILSQFWMLKVQNQGVSEAMFPLKVLGKNF